jgi:hypothetical protein
MRGGKSTDSQHNGQMKKAKGTNITLHQHESH